MTGDVTLSLDNTGLGADQGYGADALRPTTWEEQDNMLRSLWLKGEPPQSIAAALQRTVGAVMTRAARIGLPRRLAPGRKPQAHALSRIVKKPVVKREPIAEVVDTAVTLSGGPAVRSCLMCLNKFQSAGRHNRICSPCKGSSAYEAGSRVPHVEIPI